jgi:FkbM family methyltransferase
MKSVMSLTPSPQTAPVAPAGYADFYRKPNLTTTPGIATEATSHQKAAPKGGGKYPASGIVSYAQNREDILLWRALRDLPEGFYIDLGAENPTQNSVTRAFYERGWHGINVEPVPSYFDKLCDERPRDLTLQLAIGDRMGWSTLYEFPDTGLSTLLEGVASRHQSKGFRYIERRVPILTLSSLWEDFVKGEVHFLKIDVEGYEPQVLAGMDLAHYRPWIILIEATEPLTFEGAWHQWEGKILEAQYEFVHFDGLNRWYLATERSELKERFDAPPNIFDQFELAATVSVCNRLAAAERDLVRIRASASWRWTAPLRAVRDWVWRLAFGGYHH